MNDNLWVCIWLFSMFVVGALLSYYITGALMKITTPTPVIIDSLPVCNGELYTPGTCGVDSGITFYQCKPNTTGIK